MIYAAIALAAIAGFLIGYLWAVWGENIRWMPAICGAFDMGREAGMRRVGKCDPNIQL